MAPGLILMKARAFPSVPSWGWRAPQPSGAEAWLLRLECNRLAAFRASRQSFKSERRALDAPCFRTVAVASEPGDAHLDSCRVVQSHATGYASRRTSAS